MQLFLEQQDKKMLEIIEWAIAGAIQAYNDMQGRYPLEIFGDPDLLTHQEKLVFPELQVSLVGSYAWLKLLQQTSLTTTPMMASDLREADHDIRIEPLDKNQILSIYQVHILACGLCKIFGLKPPNVMQAHFNRQICVFGTRYDISVESRQLRAINTNDLNIDKTGKVLFDPDFADQEKLLTDRLLRSRDLRHFLFEVVAKSPSLSSTEENHLQFYLRSHLKALRHNFKLDPGVALAWGEFISVHFPLYEAARKIYITNQTKKGNNQAETELALLETYAKKVFEEFKSKEKAKEDEKEEKIKQAEREQQRDARLIRDEVQTKAERLKANHDRYQRLLHEALQANNSNNNANQPPNFDKIMQKVENFLWDDESDVKEEDLLILLAEINENDEKIAQAIATIQITQNDEVPIETRTEQTAASSSSTGSAPKPSKSKAAQKKAKKKNENAESALVQQFFEQNSAVNTALGLANAYFEQHLYKAFDEHLEENFIRGVCDRLSSVYRSLNLDGKARFLLALKKQMLDFHIKSPRTHKIKIATVVELLFPYFGVKINEYVLASNANCDAYLMNQFFSFVILNPFFTSLSTNTLLSNTPSDMIKWLTKNHQKAHHDDLMLAFIHSHRLENNEAVFNKLLERYQFLKDNELFAFKNLHRQYEINRSGAAIPLANLSRVCFKLDSGQVIDPEFMGYVEGFVQSQDAAELQSAVIRMMMYQYKKHLEQSAIRNQLSLPTSSFTYDDFMLSFNTHIEYFKKQNPREDNDLLAKKMHMVNVKIVSAMKSQFRTVERRYLEVSREFTPFRILANVFDNLNANHLYETWWKNQADRRERAFQQVNIQRECLIPDNDLIDLSEYLIQYISNWKIGEPYNNLNFKHFCESCTFSEFNMTYCVNQVIQILANVPQHERSRYVKNNDPQFWQKFDEFKAYQESLQATLSTATGVMSLSAHSSASSSSSSSSSSASAALTVFHYNNSTLS